MAVGNSRARVPSKSNALSGVDAFIADVSRQVACTPWNRRGAIQFVRCIGDRYAYIRLQDVWQPLRFLRQMAGDPPVQFGAHGFAAHLVDDPAPARHYTALLFVGFWLPKPLATAVLWLWEGLGFVRYHGHWSQPDMRMGRVGIRHGRLLARYGPTILPALIAADLAER